MVKVMKKHLGELIIIFSLLILIVPIKAKAANLSFKSIEMAGREIVVRVVTDTTGDYQLDLYYSQYDEELSQIYDSKHAIPKTVGDRTEFTFYIDTLNFDSGVYCITAYLRNPRNITEIFGSCEIYKRIEKGNGYTIMTDYEIPDPTVSKPIVYNNVSEKDKKDITKETTKFLKYVKKYNVNGMKSCLKKVPKNSFLTNKDIQQFIKKAHKKHFKYQVREISVKGKKAKVKLDVRYYNATDATKYGLKKILKNKNEKVLTNAMKKYYKSDGDNIITTSISISLIKSKGKWIIKNMPDSVQVVTDCRIIDTINYYESNPLELIL